MFGGGNHERVGHRVVGAGKGDVWGVLGWLFAESGFELVFERSRDRDDRDLDCLEEVPLFVGGSFEFEVFWSWLMGNGHGSIVHKASGGGK